MVVTTGGGKLLASNGWRSGMLANHDTQDSLMVRSFPTSVSLVPREVHKPWSVHFASHKKN